MKKAIFVFVLIFFSGCNSRDDWNHAELLTHLKVNGVELEGFWTGEDEANGPAQRWATKEELDKNEGYGREIILGSGAYAYSQIDFVYVQKCITSQSAKDMAGTVPGAY